MDPELLFAEFLERWHGGSGTLAELCAAHPEHAERFTRWWSNLVRFGETTEEGKARESVAAAERFGPYRLLHELGRGAQAEVHLAEDERLGRRVALKVLAKQHARGDEFERRFAREAELAGRLDHPGICTVYERGTLDGRAFLAMRFVEGESLAAAIARACRTGGTGSAVRLPPLVADADEGAAIAGVVHFFERAALALQAAHEAHLVHRDVKPANLLVDVRGDPVFVDFGLAVDLEAPALTLTGDLVGTPAYMSPEQIEGRRRDIDARTDVYSLGVSLHEALTGRRPFEEPTRERLYHRILSGERESVRLRNPAVPRDLEIVVATALERDTKLRYQSAAALAEDLRRVRAKEPILARRPNAWTTTRRFVERHPALCGLATALGLAIVAALVALGALVVTSRRAHAAFARLGDRTLLEAALREAESCYPARADRVVHFDGWLHRYAEPLAERLPAHRAELERLRARALPEDPRLRAEDRAGHPAQAELATLRREEAALESCRADPKKESVASLRRYFVSRLAEVRARVTELERVLASAERPRFATAEEQVAFDALAALTEDVATLLAPDGLAARVRQDREIAATRVPDPSAFVAVSARLRDDARFSGAELAPQVGLVPLGPDPASRLEEFAVHGTGAIPRRDPTEGRLELPEGGAIVLVLLPPGLFRISPPSESSSAPYLSKASAPQAVRLDRFFLAKHELSHAQWLALGGTRSVGDAYLRANGGNSPNHPIESVAWSEVSQVLARHDLVLPTETQWEYGARAGASGRYWWGDNFPGNDRRVANVRDVTSVLALGHVPGPNFRFDDGVATTAPIGFSDPNAFGLHDVLGNVAEWCSEPFSQFGLVAFTGEDGNGEHHIPHTGERTARGGHFGTAPLSVSLGYREGFSEVASQRGVGVRVARSVQ